MEGAAKGMFIKKIIQNGNSWAVTLPRAFLRPLGYKPGQWVQIRVLPNNALLLTPIEEEIYDVRRV